MPIAFWCVSVRMFLAAPGKVAAVRETYPWWAVIPLCYPSHSTKKFVLNVELLHALTTFRPGEGVYTAACDLHFTIDQDRVQLSAVP